MLSEKKVQSTTHRFDQRNIFTKKKEEKSTVPLPCAFYQTFKGMSRSSLATPQISIHIVCVHYKQMVRIILVQQKNNKPSRMLCTAHIYNVFILQLSPKIRKSNKKKSLTNLKQQSKIFAINKIMKQNSRKVASQNMASKYYR